MSKRIDQSTKVCRSILIYSDHKCPNVGVAKQRLYLFMYYFIKLGDEVVALRLNFVFSCNPALVREAGVTVEFFDKTRGQLTDDRGV